MKNTYLSECQFKENCPFARDILLYISAAMPSGAEIHFENGRKKYGEECYIANFFVCLRNGSSGYVELSCNPSADGLEIRELSKSESLE